MNPLVGQQIRDQASTEGSGPAYIDARATGDLVTVGRVLEDNKPNVWLLNAVGGELKAGDVRHRIHGFAGCRQRSDLQDVNRRRNADPVADY